MAKIINQHSISINANDIFVASAENVVFNHNVAGFKAFAFIIHNQSSSTNSLSTYKVYTSPNNINYYQQTSGSITTAAGSTSYIDLSGTKLPVKYIRLTLTCGGEAVVDISLTGE